MSETVEKIEIEYEDTPIQAATKLIQARHNGRILSCDFFNETELEEIANHLLAYTKGFHETYGGDTDA